MERVALFKARLARMARCAKAGDRRATRRSHYILAEIARAEGLHNLAYNVIAGRAVLSADGWRAEARKCIAAARRA